jgi:D-3-phosphoglycerate dehydrogenase
MPDWNILVTDGLDESGLAILRQSSRVDNLEGISAAELIACISQYDAVIVRGRSRLTAEVILRANALKVIGRAGVGVDNIDLQAARECGIMVVNAPSSTSLAVAELTLGLMLALARMIPRADVAMKAGSWIKKDLEGIELFGKTLGIIGVGNIGKNVAVRSAALGMQVIGYDPLLSDDQIQRNAAEPVSLEYLYHRADFISLHIPLTPETRGLVNERAFSQMKPGVRIICTARGGVIDEAALLAGLESGQIAGAALDVFADEPPGLIPLVAHPNLIATPHIGAQTAEAQERAAADIAHEVLAGLRGEALRWRVI